MAQREQELQKKLDDSLGAFATERRLKKSNAPETAEYVESVYNEIAGHAYEHLNQQDSAELRNPYSQDRYYIASRVLSEMAAKKAGESAQKPRDDRHTQGAVAKSGVEILKNRQKYGLDDKKEEDIAELLWFSTGANNDLNPETIKEQAIAKKKELRRLELEEKIKNPIARERQLLVDNAKIEAKGLSEKEYRDARRESTIEYFEKISGNENIAALPTNSEGELRDAESNLIQIASLGAASKDTVLSQGLREKVDAKFVELGQKIPVIGGLIKSGEGVQFFTNPKAYLASKIVANIGTRIASNTLIGSALGAIAAMTGPAGWLVQGGLALIQGIIGDKLTRALVNSFNKLTDTFKKAGGGLAIAGAVFISGLGNGMLGGAFIAGATTIIVAPLVIFFIFIINAGGHVVPPGSYLNGSVGSGNNPPGGGAAENAYIRVTKTPNPPGPFPNIGDLPKTIQYKIVILAKKEDLTNISFEYKCQVVGANSALTCPNPSPAIPTPPATIAAGESFTINYSATYTAPYFNSVVTDILTVTATTKTAGVQKAAGFASVVFGAPPTACFNVDNSWDSFPQQRTWIYQAIGQIITAKKYTEKLCSTASTITLKYVNQHACYNRVSRTTSYRNDGCISGETEFGGYAGRYPTIEFYWLGVSNPNSAFYTLAHESGHGFARVPGALSGFINNGGIKAEGFICTYPLSQSQGEDFAENIALYFAGQSPISATRDFRCMNGGNLFTRYPEHWEYARNLIFEEQLGWPNSN